MKNKKTRIHQIIFCSFVEWHRRFAATHELLLVIFSHFLQYLKKKHRRPNTRNTRIVCSSAFKTSLFSLSRVPEDRHRDRHRLCHHGLHRLLCQAHPHPHQQHHCGIVDGKDMMRNKECLSVVAAFKKSNVL